MIFIFVSLGIIFIFIYYFLSKNTELNDFIKDSNSVKQKIKSEENDLREQLQKTYSQKLSLDSKVKELRSEKDQLSDTIKEYNEQIQKLNQTLTINIKSQEELSKMAYKSYCEILDKKYDETDKEYESAISTLKEKYNVTLKEQTEAIHSLSQEIEELKKTRQSIIEAARKEKIIQENSENYCLKLTDEDMADIAKLDSIKKSLNKPRILSMLIWQTWFQKPLKTLSANILGSKEVTGVYKITNILTNECYIGQAVDVAKRWAEHAKCGLGIDTPAGNKLYAAMKEYGLWSFSWELLEECPKNQLNEKEAFYISMYQAVLYGYNSSKGLTK